MAIPTASSPLSLPHVTQVAVRGSTTDPQTHPPTDPQPHRTTFTFPSRAPSPHFPPSYSEPRRLPLAAPLEHAAHDPLASHPPLRHPRPQTQQALRHPRTSNDATALLYRYPLEHLPTGDHDHLLSQPRPAPFHPLRPLPARSPITSLPHRNQLISITVSPTSSSLLWIAAQCESTCHTIPDSSSDQTIHYLDPLSDPPKIAIRKPSQFGADVTCTLDGKVRLGRHSDYHSPRLAALSLIIATVCQTASHVDHNDSLRHPRLIWPRACADFLPGSWRATFLWRRATSPDFDGSFPDSRCAVRALPSQINEKPTDLIRPPPHPAYQFYMQRRWAIVSARIVLTNGIHSQQTADHWILSATRATSRNVLTWHDSPTYIQNLIADTI